MTCDPYSTIKEPECLLKLQLVQLNLMARSHQATLEMYERLAPLQEDYPSLAWNGDGTHIYVLGAYGLYDVNVENGNYTTIGEGAFHGSVDWAPPQS